MAKKVYAETHDLANLIREKFTDHYADYKHNRLVREIADYIDFYVPPFLSSGIDCIIKEDSDGKRKDGGAE